MPVALLQEHIGPHEFAELLVYDNVWGLERHAEIRKPPEQTTDFESLARARMGTPTGETKPTSLNRRISPSKLKARNANRPN